MIEFAEETLINIHGLNQYSINLLSLVKVIQNQLQIIA